MTNRYTESDRGRFDSYLIDRRCGVAIAYTDYNVVRLTESYREDNRAAVEEFAESYELPIEWGNRC